ncbi:ParB-like protein [Paraburkholderia tropica]|uniref:ParB-like protein n=1 Tax=Paraburkholderia tropica TaxID=92647 RepID=UPI0007EC86D4|nr:ParB/Srx family N-terminal domain-containing protein [Paraburkholderia tropica]OBR46600.1 chromosome partitioning protein ParB [Paraburkholderia tropica]
MKNVSIDELRPTQATHGLREVEQKAAQYRSMSRHELKMAIAEKPIPIVLGPDQVPFAIDHHHVAAALNRIKIDAAPCVLVADLSTLSPAQFWLRLEEHCWVHPFDREGRRISFLSIPRHVNDLVDDEYRSLAAFVRDAGGFERTLVPLAEFRWADLFRSILPLTCPETRFDAMVKKALKLSRSRLAVGMPGYLGGKGGKVK